MVLRQSHARLALNDAERLYDHECIQFPSSMMMITYQDLYRSSTRSLTVCFSAVAIVRPDATQSISSQGSFISLHYILMRESIRRFCPTKCTTCRFIFTTTKTKETATTTSTTITTTTTTIIMIMII